MPQKILSRISIHNKASRLEIEFCSIKTDFSCYWLDDWGSIPDKGKICLSYSWALTDSNPVVPTGSVSGSNMTGI